MNQLNIIPKAIVFLELDCLDHVLVKSSKMSAFIIEVDVIWSFDVLHVVENLILRVFGVHKFDVFVINCDLRVKSIERVLFHQVRAEIYVCGTPC